MALTLEEQLAQMGISPEDFKALLASKRQNTDSAPPPPPPPPQPQEEPGCAQVKVIIENTYKEQAYHEQPSTFGKGKIHIKRAKVTAPTSSGTGVGFVAAPGNLDRSFFAFIESLKSRDEGEMYIADFERRMEKKFPSMPGQGNVLVTSSWSSNVQSTAIRAGR
ncbi:hypothetical protein EST38_g7940 [Candolleomyces aberdarensis]|uniref:Uncharacterized protein n=1 Tax=Candolleomyces aberdarensis TaxID=2316362 RepID=A0A4Q2DGP5_9AGAR|nr:hypothetical protein EST38_g7940 [Candolleomyces aberdarensis]